VYDILLLDGTVIDGTKAPQYRADVAIQGDRICRIGDLKSEKSRTCIAAQGLVVAPGFVDVHNHSDAWVLKMPHFRPKTMQGFTTEVLMVDGISYAPVDAHTAREWIYYMRPLNALLYEEYQGWESLSDYRSCLHGRTAQNTILHIPYGNVRSLSMGYGRQAPDDFQMQSMQTAITQGMAEGAVGLSTGLDYICQCFSTTDELVDACRAMAAQQGVYTTHVRYKRGTLAGVQEAVEIGRRAGVPVHVSHLKATKPEDIDAILGYVDRVACQEVDFSFDLYPYVPGSTTLNFLLPYEVWEDGPFGVLPRLKNPQVRARFAQSLASWQLDQIHIAWLPGKENSRYQGRLLSDYVAQVGRPPADALCDLLIEEQLGVLLVFHYGDDALIHPFLAHPRHMIGTDGIYFPDGVVHPRLYGSAARLLGPCVRQHRLFSLEEAVYKLSGFAASRFGLEGRGVLREGCFADVVVFDPETIADRATYADPHQYSTGVEHVLVNGVPIVSGGQPVESLPTPLPGRALRYRRSP
jgi:N-acyl-D-amino-acid deacylase